MTISTIQPCTINPGIVTGPNNKLREKTISRQECQARLHAHENEIRHEIKKNKNKSKEKTPLAVKIGAGIVGITTLLAFLKYKFKKI
jgi:hypothetical protein